MENSDISTEMAAGATGAVRKSYLAFDVALLLLSPIVAWAALGFSLINQNGNLDPWIYTGYGQGFENLVRIHGWYYYALRFPVVFLNTICCAGDAPVLGYGLLRYALLLMAGVPLYLLARREFGRPIAICSYLFLFFNPLLARILLWDLTTFVSIPAALSGIAIWMLADKRRRLGRVVAGALFAASINSHVFTATAIGCFVLVDIAFALFEAESRRKIVLDLVAAALGAAGMIALGVLYYRARLGEFDPSLLVSVNLAAVRAGNAYAAANSRPFTIWFPAATYAYVPLILLGAVVALYRVWSRAGVERRIRGFFVVYCAFYAIYCFLGGGFVVYHVHYFAHLTIAVYVAIPMVIALLARATRAAGPVAVAFALGLLLPMFALRLWFERVSGFFSQAYGELSNLAVFWVLSGLLVILLGISRLPRRVVVTAAFLTAIAIQFATLIEPSHRMVFDRRRTSLERSVYRAAVEYARFSVRYDEREHRVLVWYPRLEYSLFSMSYTRLGDAVNDPFAGPGMPTIGQRELDRLASPENRYVMLLATKPEDIARGKAALDQAGIRFRPVESRDLGDAGYSAIAELVEIVRSAS